MSGRGWLSFLVLGATFATGGLAAGCTIYTSSQTGAPPPRPRPRAHRPPPPAAPRPATPAAAPTQATPAPAAKLAPSVANVVAPAGALLQPPKDDPPSTRSKPQQLPPGVGTGRPKRFRPGAPVAYWIWQGPRGHWRLRTTSHDEPHVFRGFVHPVETSVGGVEPSRTEFRDRVWERNGSFAFSFKTKSHADGFTFVAENNGCVRFDLQLDGGPEPKRIFVGAREVQPSSNHFVVCPKNAPSLRPGRTPTRRP